MSILEQKAAALYGEKKYPEALDIYLTLYKKSPKTEKYSIFCGNCFDALGNPDQAIKFYKKASKLNPVSVTSLIALANIYYNNGDYKNSEKFSLRILKKFPDNASALLNLGNIAYCRGNFNTALAYYETVYKNNNASYIAVINMANTCCDLNRYVKALDYVKKALKLYPSSVDAYIIRGNAYLELGKYEKAETALLKALEFRDDNPWIYNSLSRMYQKLENWEQALENGWKSVIYAGDAQEEQHINFGYLLYECVDEIGIDLAKRYAARWRSDFADNKIVTYMADAILNDKDVKQADREYIQRIFDTFAGDFDSTLAGLEYQVPEHIAETVQTYCKKGFGKVIRYLDLGCGTGLCGQAVKSVIGWSEVTGVDLSEKMLQTAKEKFIYDSLIVDDIINFLTQTDKTYHLVTAGDVLTYFGDLQKLFENTAHVLNENGLFVFSVSENFLNNDDYFLMPSGRFLHNTDYILKLLKKAGFNKLGMERKALRNEGDRVVYGYIIAAEKILTIKK